MTFPHRHRARSPKTGVIRGLEAPTCVYLGRDCDLFSSTPDEAVKNFALGTSREDVADAVDGLARPAAPPMTEDELED